MTEMRMDTVAEPSAAHVIAAFLKATDEQLTAGQAWYQDAHAIAADLDPADPRRAAGVLAALSPQTNWDRNVFLARLAYEQGHASGTLGRSVQAANRILCGEDPEDVLTGPKVRAFFRLIADPSDRTTVVIDRHAVDVAVGERLDDKTRTARYPLARRGWYDRMAEAYRQAADSLGMPPAWIQATTWLVHRSQLPTRRGMWAPASV